MPVNNIVLKRFEDSASPSELLRLIRQLDPGAAVVPRDGGFYLKSVIRLVSTTRHLMEMAHPIELDGSTAADAVFNWWIIAVTDLNKAQYLAFGPNFYRFNHLGFWEQLTDQAIDALDEMLPSAIHEECEEERKEEEQDTARWLALQASRRNPVTEDAEAWKKAGVKIGGMIGVLWGIFSKRK